VAYQDPDGRVRSLSVFDGLKEVSELKPSTTIGISGFWTPKSGDVVTKIGAVAYEGDLGASGDGMKLNGAALTNALNPATNFFTSSITTDEGGESALGPQRPGPLDRTPNQPNTFGFDADVFATTNALGHGVQSATFGANTAETDGETFLPGVLTFATDMYAPKIVPS
jgi:hypothetical protein